MGESQTQVELEQEAVIRPTFNGAIRVEAHTNPSRKPPSHTPQTLVINLWLCQMRTCTQRSRYTSYGSVHHGRHRLRTATSHQEL